ncbi:uncharacterized protein [Epargyreus clarus]|uniref:uncharacterized protein n=1 Tax=Epargyreus clarus TaxID=520877 RepID=UPI003C2CB2BA
MTRDVEANVYITADDMWSSFEKYCRKEAEAVLGISKGGLDSNINPTWWNDDVKASLKTKKEHFKQWQSSGSDEDRTQYINSKKIAKRKVAQNRLDSRNAFYSRLEIAKNDKDIFKAAKQRHAGSLDMKINKYVKDDKGHLLTKNDKINNRWCQ